MKQTKIFAPVEVMPRAPAPFGPLTDKERAEYNETKARLKQIIENDVKGKFEAANLLFEADRNKLYREEYHTFSAFVENEFRFKVRRAYQMIAEALVLRELPENVQTFCTNPSLLAELGKVPVGKRGQVLEVAQSQADKLHKPLTARLIREAAEKLGFGQKLLPAPKQSIAAAAVAGLDGKEGFQMKALVRAWRAASTKVRVQFQLHLTGDTQIASLGKIIAASPEKLARQ